MAESKLADAYALSADRQLASALETIRALRDQIADERVIREAFEADDAARIIVNESGLIVVCNPLAEQIFGDIRNENACERVFGCVQRRHGRRRSESSVVQRLPMVSYGLELFTRLQTCEIARIRERVVIDSRMKGLLGALLSVVPLMHNAQRWLKIEVNEVDSVDDDNLTRLPNEERFVRKVAEAILQEGPISVLYFDVDEFKGINDRYGHAAGDDILAGIGERASNCAQRSTDFLARIHGDEFAVLVRDDLAAAQGLGERICAEVRDHPFTTRCGAGIYATISVGAAEYEPDDTAEALIARADAQLLQAKLDGRDCVTANIRPLRRP